MCQINVPNDAKISQYELKNSWYFFMINICFFQESWTYFWLIQAILQASLASDIQMLLFSLQVKSVVFLY